MRKVLIVILISLFIFSIITPIAAQNTNEEVSITINSLSGIVYRKTDQGFLDFFKTVVWKRILKNYNIKTGETIKTDPDSKLSLNIGEVNRVEIKSDSILNIEEDTNSLNQKLVVEKGIVWINSTIDKNQEISLQVDTPSCTISTAQAIFTVEIIKGRTFLFMETGEAVITEKTTQSEEIINEGQVAVVEDQKIKLYEKISETNKS